MLATTAIMVPISAGELIDKITILEIKRDRLRSHQQLSNVQLEYELLTQVRLEAVPESQSVHEITQQLKSVNEQLWDIEQRIRDIEQAQQFNDQFIQLARSVYQCNDRRAKLKRQINELLGCELKEEKSYV